MKQKKKINYTKGFKTKKKQLKEQGSKLKYKTNIIIGWRVKLKKKLFKKNNIKNNSS